MHELDPESLTIDSFSQWEWSPLLLSLCCAPWFSPYFSTYFMLPCRIISGIHDLFPRFQVLKNKIISPIALNTEPGTW